jgi:hypothetical protein
MEVKLILVDLIKVALNIIVVLEGQAEVVLSEVGGSTLSLKPHALHIVHVQTLIITRVFTEGSHGLLSLFNLIIANHVT